MITEQSVIKISENALIQKVSDEMVILDSESGQYYTLNEVAADVLELLQEGKNIGEVTSAICEQYDANQHEVEEDVNDLVNSLLSQKLASLA